MFAFLVRIALGHAAVWFPPVWNARSSSLTVVVPSAVLVLLLVLAAGVHSPE